MSTSSNQSWPQRFRQLVVANCRYWLDYAAEDVNKLVPEIAQVLRGLDYALVSAEAWPVGRDLTLRLSTLMMRQGQGVQWESFLVKSIDRSAQEKDPAEIELRLHLGNLYRLQGRLPEARACLQTALDLCQQADRRTHYWALLNLLGLVARLSAQHEEALAYSQQVLDAPDVPAPERAEAFNVRGFVGYDRRQWEEALHDFDQALALYRSLGHAYEMARMLNNRGLVLLRSDNWAEAQESYREAIQQFRISGDQAESFKAVMNLGNVFLMKKEYDAAIQQYQEALPVFRQGNQLIDLANAYNNLGMAYTGLADWETAETYFLAALEITHNLNNRYTLADFLDNFGEMLIKAERLKEAYDVLNQALEALDNVPDSPAATFLRQFIEDRLAQLKDSL